MTTDITRSASKDSTDQWENEGGPARPRRMSLGDDLQDELRRYGITPIQLTVFDWGGYRYSNSKDAIAAARRLAISA